jgi:hypothetical protein
MFGHRRVRFVVSFLALARFGPIAFHLIGAWLLTWSLDMAFTIDIEQFVIAYSIEVGLLVGVAMMLPLLPRTVSSRERSSSREGSSIAVGANKNS